MKIEKILVSQPQGAEAKKYYDEIAQKYNVQIDFKQFISIESVSPKEFRAQKVSILPDHTAIIFTSRHAIDHFFNLCHEMRVNIPDTLKYFCISELVALYIQKYVQYRKRKVFFSPDGHIDGLMNQILRHPSETYFLPQSSVHTDDIKNYLEEHGIKHDEAVMYRTVSKKFENGELDGYDMFIFFSPAGIDSLLENKPDFKQGKTLIGCFGPNAAQAIREHGFRLDLEAPTEECPSMTMALEHYLAKNSSKKK
ncbi:MAG: uroporphyrinogen-III synthase [Bacteroidaceae bacterium]|nr:uroporphyrinogen-III synthase [Bacteroidaceae bacterium]MBP5322647.1 uroporphyrinogen-III synthase [Bacteroidaceae bacterium]